MKRIYITSHYRLLNKEQQPDGETGRFYVLDWDTKELLRNPLKIEPGEHGPLGRSHGARGITICNNKIYIAGSGDKISIFNMDTYELENMFSSPRFSALHQIKTHKGLIYACSTGLDQVVCVGGKSYSLDKYKDIIDSYVYKISDHVFGNDRLHFNSITWAPNGDEYHVYFSARMLFNYTKGEIVYAHGVLDGPHDALFIDNEHVIVNSSKNRETIEINIRTKETQTILTQDSWGDKEGTRIMGFTRGLAKSGNLLFACSHPTRISLLERNKRNYSKIQEFDLNRDPRECIYDIVLDPRDWQC